MMKYIEDNRLNMKNKLTVWDFQFVLLDILMNKLL